jgi:YHS domain-containing protein
MKNTRLLLSATVLSAALLVGGCAAINAQNPSGNLRPVNAHVVGEQSGVMLKGNDVVSYFTQGKHAMGSPQFASTYENVTFHFASAAHKALFDKEPTKYIPQFGGYCANGVAYGIPWGGDADTWRIEGGKLYIFGGKDSKDAFELDVPGNMKLAQKYWDDEIKGANSFIQRTKRIVFKVPHYKSGEELAKMVAAAKK